MDNENVVNGLETSVRVKNYVGELEPGEDGWVG